MERSQPNTDEGQDSVGGLPCRFLSLLSKETKSGRVERNDIAPEEHDGAKETTTSENVLEVLQRGQNHDQEVCV